jgi:protoporphyrin/coproporphyrin ferrochelatase
MDQTAIVLFNLGGPSNLAAVEPFLINLFSDREIIQLPGGAALQPTMARLIAKLRGPSVRENYRRIGGGSPQLRITRDQANALEVRLNARWGGYERFRVFIAMRYSRPSATDALEAIAAAGIRRIVTLTLFPHYSKATTGSSRNEFDRALAAPQWKGQFEVSHIEHYPTDSRYVEAVTDTVRVAWNGIPASRRDKTVLLFSAHGLPQRFIDAGDPYVSQIDATRFAVLERLNLPNRQRIAYQSRTGPVRWIGPGTEETIKELAEEGVTDVLVIPLSFVSDHIETLYEVDMLFADAARDAGITGYYRTRALNTHPMFIEALAGLVHQHLSKPAEYRGVRAAASELSAAGVA